MSNISADTIARTICLVLALANQILAIFGKDMLPFGEESIYQIVSLVATFITAGVAWWKNNSFTSAAIKADKYMNELKEKE